MATTATLSRPSTTARLFERTVASPHRVDRKRGILRDVKVLGRFSRNGREYLPAVMRGAVHLYDGIKICMEHLTKGRKQELVGDTIGVLRNPNFRDDAIFGDLHILKSHPKAEYILDVAESVPNSIGLSHDAEGETRQRRGMDDVVTSLTKINSVDLVACPASVGGLFESGGHSQAQSAQYPDTQAEFVREMKRPTSSMKRGAPSHAVTQLTEARQPLAIYPRSHRGFVEAMRKPKHAIENGKVNGLLKRPTRRLQERDITGDLELSDHPNPSDGQLAEILSIVDDEVLDDEQKVLRIQVLLDSKEGSQLDEFRDILDGTGGDAQKLKLIAILVDDQRVAVEDVAESFRTKLSRGTWRR